MDADTLAYYRALPSPIKEEILCGITCGEEGAHFALCANGKCPNLDERGLCRIISALGEGALCDICREHPRFYNEVSGRLEVGLGAACEAAAALILSADTYAEIVPLDAEEGEVCVGGFDAVSARAALYALLGDRARDYDARRETLGVTYGFAWHAKAATERLLVLEFMDEAHRDLLLSAAGAKRGGAHDLASERFLAYLIYRHASAAESAEAFGAAVRMALFIEGLFARLVENGLDEVQAAILLSEELEYSEENTAALLQ